MTHVAHSATFCGNLSVRLVSTVFRGNLSVRLVSTVFRGNLSVRLVSIVFRGNVSVPHELTEKGEGQRRTKQIKTKRKVASHHHPLVSFFQPYPVSK